MALEIFRTRGAVCGGFVSGEMLAGEVGDQYILPETLVPEADDFSTRVDSERRALTDGEAAWGGQVEARKFSVSGLVGGDSEAQTRALMQAIRARAARPGQKLSIQPGGPYLHLAFLENFDHKWEALSGRRLVRVAATWLLADPFWYSTAVGQVHADLAGDGSIPVDTGDLATWWMPPVLILTAPAGESVPSVTLVNETDGGVGLTYSDPAFADGAVVVIDCERGTVTRDGTDSIRYLGGRPLRLLPGENTLSYTGAACAVSIQWRERWI